MTHTPMIVLTMFPGTLPCNVRPFLFPPKIESDVDEKEIKEVVDTQSHPSGFGTSMKMPKPLHSREVCTDAIWPQDVIAFEPLPKSFSGPRCSHTILKLHNYSTSNSIQEGHVYSPYHSQMCAGRRNGTRLQLMIKLVQEVGKVMHTPCYH